MGSRLKVSVIFSSFALTILLVVGAVLGKSEEKQGAYRPLGVYTEVLARIKSDYVEDPDIPKVTEGALQGLVEYLDPLSSYLSAEQYEEYRQSHDREDARGLASCTRGLEGHDARPDPDVPPVGLHRRVGGAGDGTDLLGGVPHAHAVV